MSDYYLIWVYSKYLCFVKTMTNHTEILNKLAKRIKVFFQSRDDVEEDLWPPAREVILELKHIIDSAEPPIEMDNSSG